MLDPKATLARDLVAALASGRACLHPTDTLPGLAFDPRLASGSAAVAAVKGRPLDKTCLALVPSLAAACRFFAPLPPGWERALARLWPGPLSVVWTAGALAPKSLVAEDGTIGLRVPRLAAGAAWVVQAMKELDAPLPTTSVNASGHPPMATWAAAARFAAAAAAFVPAWDAPYEAPGAAPVAAPSTILRLSADGGYSVLRAGAMPLASIAAALGEAH